MVQDLHKYISSKDKGVTYTWSSKNSTTLLGSIWTSYLAMFVFCKNLPCHIWHIMDIDYILNYIRYLLKYQQHKNAKFNFFCFYLLFRSNIGKLLFLQIFTAQFTSANSLILVICVIFVYIVRCWPVWWDTACTTASIQLLWETIKSKWGKPSGFFLVSIGNVI